MVQGEVFLKTGARGGGLEPFLFNFFKILNLDRQIFFH